MKIKNLIFLLVFVLIAFSSCKSSEDTAPVTDMGVGQETEAESMHTEAESMYTEPPAQEMEEKPSEGQHSIVGNVSASGRCFYGAAGNNADTFTGLTPLEKVIFQDIEIRSTDTLSTEMISHSYGVAVDEKPHTISTENQKFFDEKLFDAVCLDTKTEEKVLYLTFDCGYENGYTSKILDVLKEKQVTAAFFCTLPQIKDNAELIARMINEGHIVGNHSVTHPDFSTLSVSEIVDEIKGFDDYLREKFGYSSLYFRFPQGKYSEKAMAVINDLGYKCVFWSLAYADWDTENQKGAMYAYETVLSRIHPGSVMLLHSVSSDNALALSDIIDTALERGYVFRSLEDMS